MQGSSPAPNIYAGERELRIATPAETWEARAARYSLYWAFYLGQHWGSEQVKHEVELVMNYVRRLVNKGVVFLFGKGIDFTFGDKGSQPKIDEYARKVLRRNRFALKLLEIGQSGFVCGDAFVKVSYREKPGDELVLTVYDPAWVQPYWDTLTKEITAVEVKFVMFEPGEMARTFSSSNYSEYWTKDEVIVRKKGEETKMQNPLGFVPFVHFRNFPVTAGFYGISEIEDVIPMNRELNKNMSNAASILDYHRAPILVVKGARGKGLTVAPNQIWDALPKDSQVSYLTYDSPQAAMNSFLTSLMNGLFDVSGVPEFALSGRGVPTNTSGAALKLQHMSMMEMLSVKQLTYGQGLEELIRMVALVANKTGHLSYEPDDFPDLKFPDPLPDSESDELGLWERRITLGVETRRSYLKVKNPKMTDEEIARYLEASASEQAQFNPFLMTPPGGTPGGGRAPAGGEQPAGEIEGVFGTPVPGLDRLRTRMKPFSQFEAGG